MTNPNKRRRLNSNSPEEPNDRLLQTFHKIEPLLCELISASQSITDLPSILGTQRANFIIALRSMIWVEETPSRQILQKSSTSLGKRPEKTIPLPTLPPPTPQTTPKWPPHLPEIQNPQLRKHALSPSTSTHHFQRLEFLGDSYLQMISSKILYTRFPHSREGPLSTMRSSLVANIPLSEYARLYDFSTLLGATGWKTLADAFEAYVAAVALSDPEHGVETLTEWLAALYEPKIVEMSRVRKTGWEVVEWEVVEREIPKGVVFGLDAKARGVLEGLVQGEGVRLEYVPVESADGVEVVVLLSGWGFCGSPVGQGWGVSEEEACVRAAMNVLANEGFCEDLKGRKAKGGGGEGGKGWKEVDGVVVLDD